MILCCWTPSVSLKALALLIICDEFYRLWRSRETILCHKLLCNACISSVAQACVWNIILVWLPCKPQWWWSSNVCCHIVERGFWGLFWKHSLEIAAFTHFTVHVFVCDLALYYWLARNPFGTILLSYSLWCIWRCVLTISQLMCIFKLVVILETWDNWKWTDWEIQVQCSVFMEWFKLTFLQKSLKGC